MYWSFGGDQKSLRNQTTHTFLYSCYSQNQILLKYPTLYASDKMYSSFGGDQRSLQKLLWMQASLSNIIVCKAQFVT
jgi:hypothetical protein